MKQKKELNPFNSKKVANEWIKSVENESGLSRDKEIYPRLQKWVRKVKPKKIVEIGCGQGICAEKIGNQKVHFFGIDPSKYLIDRANKKYKSKTREFTVADAYSLPFPDAFSDASFSVNVWFHLSNLQKASNELSRILRPNGKFLIITANPSNLDLWESFYYDKTSSTKKVVIGKVNIPVNPLSKNVFYKHSLPEIKTSLKKAGLKIEKIEQFAKLGNKKSQKTLFIAIYGNKLIA